MTTALGLEGKNTKEISSPSISSVFPSPKRNSIHVQEAFSHCVFLGFVCVIFVLFCFPPFIKGGKKKLSKNPSRTKTTNIHHWEPSNPETKNTIERLREEADQKISTPAKTHRSHSWSLCSCPTDTASSPINHFSAARAWEAQSKERPHAGSSPALRRDEGLR